MQFKIKKIAFILIFLVLLTGVAQAQEIIKLDSIDPGMEGIGKTVFHGFKVESFPVKVIDILQDQGVNGDLILIKTGGEKIDEIGGIAAGMSGTPIYLEGKLAGAIGYGWQFSDHHYALVTPIEEMLKLLKTNNDNIEESSNHKNLEGVKTPLFVSGLSGRAFNRLKDDLGSQDFTVLQGGGLKENNRTDIELKPGSAIAVQLARGDINISSIGTLTYLEDNKVLAFGHPFYNKGEVDYLLSGAYINGIIPSSQQPFKLGSPLNQLLGSITQDRGAGIAGELKKYSRIIPLRINVLDQERGISKKVNVQLIRDEDLLTTLTTNIALQTIDSTLDRIGRGTAQVNMKVMGHGLPELEVNRENVFYSQHDIAALAVSDFYQLVNIIAGNPFKEVNLIDIQLEVEINREDRVALVQEARVLNDNIKPGDTIEIEVTLRPYRQEPFTRDISLKLPDDIEPGLTSLVIDGGFTSYSYEMSPEEGGEETDINQAVIQGYKDFESIIEDYLDQPHNNELIVQVYPGYPVSGMNNQEEEMEKESEEKGEGAAGDAEGGPPDQVDPFAPAVEQPEIKEIIETEYVLEGSLTLDIEIEQGEKPVNEKSNDTNKRKEDKNI